MIWVFVTYFGLMSWLNLHKEVNSFTLESKLMKRVMNYSYKSIAKQCKSIGYEYSFGMYAKEMVIVSIVLGVACQLTLQNILITFVIVLSYLCVVPLLHLHSVTTHAKQCINQAIFSFLQTALMLLRENRTIYDILHICEECSDHPLKNDLVAINQYIDMTGNIAKGLEVLEIKYPCAFMKNLVIVLRSKSEEGTVSAQLIDYFYLNTEQVEMLVNEFIAKRKANRTLFYMIIALNAVGVTLLKNFVTIQNAQTTGMMTSVIMVYYLANLVTILCYEQWANRIDFID